MPPLRSLRRPLLRLLARPPRLEATLMSEEDHFLTPPPCKKCGGAMSLRYISYAGMPHVGGGADLSFVCDKAVWGDGFPQPCGGDEE